MTTGVYPSVTIAGIQRFWLNIELGGDDGCWVWVGSRTRGGYGRLTDHGREVYAHRFSYETLTGPIPDGLQLDHLCRNRACVNPAHLEPVTSHENTLRGAKSQRTHCSRGHRFDDTTIIYRGYRRCRTCRDEWNARRYSPRAVETRENLRVQPQVAS